MCWYVKMFKVVMYEVNGFKALRMKANYVPELVLDLL
jgi:hypothetical protein